MTPDEQENVNAVVAALLAGKRDERRRVGVD